MTDSDSPTVSAVSPSGDDFEPYSIGPYKLLERIGEGGMGEVFLAQQEEPVRRRVALKLIKPGMDTREVIARFEAERQALALMNHSNIARVYDAGTTERGRPYFVMEYIPGLSVDDYCDQERLSTVERLDLFKQICAGVQHAHQKGVLHRDIKPSNIIVTSRDGAPVPKIIDFGVAKALDHRLTEKTLFTKQGQLIGTPAYMSPEQAEFRGLEVDTRSDVYSLGVLLYELLVGEPPFDLGEVKRAALDEVVRKIKETEPHKPSTKLSTHSGDSKVVALNRRTNPSTLIRQVRGDLDWITMKAMEKEIGRRYASVSELSSDVDRYLADEPVAAGPPSRAYRMRKFVRKHRGPVAASSAIAVAVVAGLVVSLILFFELRREQDALVASLDALGLNLTFLRPDVDNTDVLDQQAAMIDQTFAGRGRTEVELRHALGFAYAQENEIPRAIEQFELAIAAAVGNLEENESPLPQIRRNLEDLRGEVTSAEVARAASAEFLAADPESMPPSLRATSLANRAVQAFDREELEDSERLASEAVAVLEGIPESSYELALARLTLGLAKAGLGKNDEAANLLRRAADSCLDHREVGGYLRASRELAAVQRRSGDDAGAEASLLAALQVCLDSTDKRSIAAAQRESKAIRDALAELYDATGRAEAARIMRALQRN